VDGVLEGPQFAHAPAAAAGFRLHVGVLLHQVRPDGPRIMVLQLLSEPRIVLVQYNTIPPQLYSFVPYAECWDKRGLGGEEEREREKERAPQYIKWRS